MLAGLAGWPALTGSHEKNEVCLIEEYVPAMAAGIVTKGAGEGAVFVHLLVEKLEALKHFPNVETGHLFIQLRCVNGDLLQRFGPFPVGHGMTESAGFLNSVAGGIVFREHGAGCKPGR